jgi:PAS domain S-box-containing protein
LRLLDAIHEYAIFIVSRQGLIESWTKGAERITGYPKRDIIGRHLSTLYGPEEAREGRPRHDLELAATADEFEREGWITRRDRSIFWADVIITAIRQGEGGARGFAVVVRDMSAWQRHEADARQLMLVEERLRIADEIRDTLIGELFRVGLELSAVAEAVVGARDAQVRVQGLVDDLDGIIIRLRDQVLRRPLPAGPVTRQHQNV